MRERDEDSEKITAEPGAVRGQAAGNPADEAKILGDQDETQDVLEAEPGELEDRPGDMISQDPAEFLEGQVDVKEQMDRETRAADYALHRRRYKPDKMKPADNDFDDKAVPTAPRPNRTWDPEMPGTEPSPR